MNPSQKPLRERTREEIDAKLERLKREQGVEPFDFDAAVKDGFDDWSEEDERIYEEWMGERKETRRAEREVREKGMAVVVNTDVVSFVFKRDTRNRVSDLMNLAVGFNPRNKIAEKARRASDD